MTSTKGKIFKILSWSTYLLHRIWQFCGKNEFYIPLVWLKEWYCSTGKINIWPHLLNQASDWKPLIALPSISGLPIDLEFVWTGITKYGLIDTEYNRLKRMIVIYEYWRYISVTVIICFFKKNFYVLFFPLRKCVFVL